MKLDDYKNIFGGVAQKLFFTKEILSPLLTLDSDIYLEGAKDTGYRFVSKTCKNMSTIDQLGNSSFMVTTYFSEQIEQLSLKKDVDNIQLVITYKGGHKMEFNSDALEYADYNLLREDLMKLYLMLIM